MSLPPVPPLPALAPRIELTAENSCNCFCFRMRKLGSHHATPIQTPVTTQPQASVHEVALTVLKL